MYNYESRPAVRDTSPFGGVHYLHVRRICVALSTISVLRFQTPGIQEIPADPHFSFLVCNPLDVMTCQY